MNRWTPEEYMNFVENVRNTPVPKEVVYGLGSLEQREAGISNKQVIQYFKNNDSVTLIDEKGQKWRKGERVYD